MMTIARTTDYLRGGDILACRRLEKEFFERPRRVNFLGMGSCHPAGVPRACVVVVEKIETLLRCQHCLA